MSIIFIAPDPDIAKNCREIVLKNPNQQGDQIEIVEALLSEAIPITRQLENQGAEVFVTRGGTAQILRQGGIRTPIVEIKLTSADLVEALTKAKKEVRINNPHIAVVAFPNMIQNLLDFLPFLNLNLSCYGLSSEEDAPHLIKEAIIKGAQVLLGGAITVKIARHLGFPVVLLRSGEESIRLALEEANRIVYARRIEAHRSNELKAMLEYAYEGIIAINHEGVITIFNPFAQSATGITEKEAIGRPISHILPSIRLTDVLESGSEDIGEIIHFGPTQVILSRIPIRVNGKVAGAIATFQDVTRIQSMEAKIRREIFSRGHFAKFNFNDIYGSSPPLLKAIEVARKYARTDATVLIHGETGVGKELFAQSIHNASERNKGPFVAVNCAALPEALLESELFGYVEGAFTGARKKGKPGLFELAHHGTIFLDEISEIPYNLQGRLLRVLQEREVIRLGHDRVIPIDVRVLCATNRDLHRLVEGEKFRKDLYWRLNVLSLYIPPLRERCEDIIPLIHYFLDQLSATPSLPPTFSTDAVSFLTTYSWPGNVRELKNLCERLTTILHDGEVIDVTFLKHLMDYQESIRLPRTKAKSIEDFERALSQAGGKVGRAADILGIHRTTVWRRLKRLSQKETDVRDLI